jgi:hypothetical protein
MSKADEGVLKLSVETAGIRSRRDSLSSIMYSEKLNSGKSSATLQSTDRHYGIVGQKPDFSVL